jgi:hypothetical protein
MNIDIRWVRLSAACGGTTFASLLRRKRYNEEQAHKDKLPEWESEGGNLASSPAATNSLVTAGSA